MDELDDESFLSLCFGPSVSIRTWLLNNAVRFQIRPSLLFTVFLGFTKDPYPYVRKAALDGLASLGNIVFEDRSMIEGCYYCAIQLLNDTEECVRSAAIRVVITWGLVLAAESPERKLYLSDEMFINLCSMTRDMSMKVRVNAFDAIKRLEIVSEDILLQSMSKRVLGFSKGKKSLVEYSSEQLEILALDVAGAFVHGVEDEFHEVRKSACDAMRNLATLSNEFAGGALNLLTDVLNDDSLFVRFQALETLYHMANNSCLKLQEAHMHMFLSTLNDSNSPVRCASRKLLKLVALPDLAAFRLSFNGLVESLETYPQEESDVFSVLFHMGKNHGNMATSIIQKVSPQIDPTSDGKLGFDSVRVAAFIVIAISTLATDDHACKIPPRLLSYAVAMFGRISHALAGVMDQSTMFAYLMKDGKNIGLSDLGFNPDEDPCSPTPKDLSNEIIASIETPAVINDQQNKDDEIALAIKTIISQVQDVWPLIQSGNLNEVLRTLRFCREALAVFSGQTGGSNGAYAFTLQYLKIVKLLAKLWTFMSAKNTHSRRTGGNSLLLGKLERRLKELRSRFIGFSKEEELHILQFLLVTYTLSLSSGEICCQQTTLRKLSIIASKVDNLVKEGSIKPSTFLCEVKRALSNLGTVNDEAFCYSFDFRELLKSFAPNQLEFWTRLEKVEAELAVPDNSYEKPLFFVPGLPVGIPCQIILRNVMRERKLWLKIRVDNVKSEYIYLDFVPFGSCDGIREFAYVAPFYRSPKASCFRARICIGLECWWEDGDVKCGRGGPKRDLAYISTEKEVYLSMSQGD